MNAREVIARAIYATRRRPYAFEEMREGFLANADAIIAALEAAGMAIVPVEVVAQLESCRTMPTATAEGLASATAHNAKRAEQIEADLRAMLKGEFTSLTIGFNDEHACSYTTAQGWHDEFGEYGGGAENQRIEWASEEERLKAIAENSVWTLQWYPNTPVGFHCIGASSLPTLLAAAKDQTDG